MPEWLGTVWLWWVVFGILPAAFIGCIIGNWSDFTTANWLRWYKVSAIVNILSWVTMLAVMLSVDTWVARRADGIIQQRLEAIHHEALERLAELDVRTQVVRESAEKIRHALTELLTEP